ncbi:YjcZ family sporulation protein [Halobacillus naozhouensis]|uniref:YjcZ family sporulation protein n=1 Tax=Halobacillus naozhouensis TaxID=554880 RepID=A0ABY8J3Q1_9BACI|nr:YjcZ family sporulation protein [Halobacillus naozhouensis]WFT76219.1 YjcZ family sporulation protein [Halobacillus naozhouensis]
MSYGCGGNFGGVGGFGGYGGYRHKKGNDFALIVVLFILLIIVGAALFNDKKDC